jgi:lysophospholipase L1-like esterase
MSGRPVIVALGDSTTAGTPGFYSPVESPPHGRGDVTSQYAYWLMRERPEWLVLNRGVNGERSDQIRARFDRDAVSEGPSLIVIIAGVNDVYQGRPASFVQEQLAWMYGRARDAGIPIVAGSIIPYNTATHDQNARMHEVNAWIRERAASFGATFCDTRAAVAAADDPDRLASSPDELHPSAEGYRLMALALRPAIEAGLQQD